MAVHVKTPNPTGLLSAIYKEIDSKKVETWSYNAQKHLFHTPQQWRNRAYLHPEVKQGELILWFKSSENVFSREVYSVYHGRFIEMLISHLAADFSIAIAAANPTS